MSLHVRIRDKGICYTCGVQKEISEMQAGHRHHGKLSLDERNIHCQCVKCNMYLSGNLGAYERRLIEEYGLEWSKQLERDAWLKGDNYSFEELEARIEELKELTKKRV